MTTRRIPDEYLARLLVILRRVRRRDPDVETALVLVTALRRAPSVGRHSLPILQVDGDCLPYRYDPDDVITCEPFEGTLTLAECVRRQEAAEPSGAGRGHKEYERCQQCKQAKAHRAMIPDYVAPKFRRFNIARDRKERTARQRLWKTGALDPVATIDSPNGEE
jgi:hypothetical protein